MSIRIRVRDKDAQLAQKMANDAAHIMDSLRNNILKERAYIGLKIVEKDYKAKIAYMQTIIDSLSCIKIRP